MLLLECGMGTGTKTYGIVNLKYLLTYPRSTTSLKVPVTRGQPGWERPMHGLPPTGKGPISRFLAES